MQYNQLLMSCPDCALAKLGVMFSYIYSKWNVAKIYVDMNDVEANEVQGNK